MVSFGEGTSASFAGRAALGAQASAAPMLAAAACTAALAFACAAPVPAWADDAAPADAAGIVADSAVLATPGSDAALAGIASPLAADLSSAGTTLTPLKNGFEFEYVFLAIPGTAHVAAQRNLLDRVNASRQERGLSTLTWDSHLEAAALARAIELWYQFTPAERPSHRSWETAIGEYFGSAQRASQNSLSSPGISTSQDVHAAWLADPASADNIFDPNVRTMGAAAFEADGTTYWVEFFVDAAGNGEMGDSSDTTSDAWPVEVAPDTLHRVFEDFEPNQWYQDSVAYALNNQLMYGYADVPRFGFYDNLTRGQAATILWRMAGEPVASADPFQDVDYGQYYGAAINWARSTGVISGYADADGQSRTFGPEDAVSREQLAAMMANYAQAIGRMDTSTDGASLSRMADASSVSTWAADSVAWCLDAGIMTGVDMGGGVREMQPQGDASRASMCAMTVNLYKLLP